MIDEKTKLATLQASTLVLTLGLTMPNMTMADGCAKPDEHTALNARALQTELMVAALACRHRDRYNAFVTKYRAELVKQGQSMQSYFRRQHGAAGQKNMNAFVTRLANGVSRRSFKERQTFCGHAAAMFNQLLSAKPAKVETIAEVAPAALGHGIPGCEDKSKASAPTRDYKLSDSNGTAIRSTTPK